MLIKLNTRVNGRLWLGQDATGKPVYVHVLDSTKNYKGVTVNTFTTELLEVWEIIE
jgi:hypothetical protein